MEPYEIIKDSDFYEPETIRMLFPQLTDKDVEQLLVLQAIATNSAFFQDMFVFENAVLALNGIKPELGFLQGCTPEQIWYAVKIIHKYFPSRVYSFEVKEYIKFMSNQQGVFIYPPEIFDVENNPYYAHAEHLSKSKILSDETTEEIQSAKYLDIQHYIFTKETEERLNQGQLNRTEFDYYSRTKSTELEGGGTGLSQPWSWQDNFSVYFPENLNQLLLLNGQTSSELYSSPKDSPSTTISFWYKYQPGSNSLSRTLLYFGYNSSIKVQSLNNRVQVLLNNGTTKTIDNALTLHGWNHILLSYPVSGSGVLYVNGQLKTVNIPFGIWDTTTDISIGGVPGVSSSLIKGNINDISVWNTVLTSGEVYQIATTKMDYRNNYGNYTSSNNLREYYLMGDNDPWLSTKIPNILSSREYFVLSNSSGINFVKETQ